MSRKTFCVSICAAIKIYWLRVVITHHPFDRFLSPYVVYRWHSSRTVAFNHAVSTSSVSILFFLVVQELLKASTCQLRLGTGVTGVVGSVKRGYSLYGQGQEKLGTFDAVIIAAPIDLAGISLDVRKEVLTVTEMCTLLMAGGFVVQAAQLLQ